MRLAYAPEFKRRFADLPRPIQKKFERQVGFLLRDIHHPSLRAKKYMESSDIWQARVDRTYRFFFQISEDTYILLTIAAHP